MDNEILQLLNDPFFVKNILVRRQKNQGQYIDGRWTPGNQMQEFEIQANVQPIDGRALSRLPEAQRTSEIRTLYTNFKLQNKVEELKRNADQIIIDGECWEVSSIENWGPMLDHQKCLIIKVTTNVGVICVE